MDSKISSFTSSQKTIYEWLQQSILPVVVVEDAESALTIAAALEEGGLNQIEITLRTPGSLKAIEAIAKRYPSMQLSAGTIRTKEDFRRAHEAGASLFISPGFTFNLAQAAEDLKVHWVPGVATASEMMMAYEAGFNTLKFFPAMAAGGPKALSGITSALSDITIVPTGGVTIETLGTWKAIPAVRAVGGTWLTANLNTTENPHSLLVQRVKEALAAWENA